MRKIIGTVIIILGILLGLYVGGWLMFIQPIIQACKAFDDGLLTGLLIGTTFLKCIFAGFVGGIIVYIGIFVGINIADPIPKGSVRKRRFRRF